MGLAFSFDSNLPCHEIFFFDVPSLLKNFKIRVVFIMLKLELRLQHKYSIRSGQESNALFIHVRD